MRRLATWQKLMHERATYGFEGKLMVILPRYEFYALSAEVWAASRDRTQPTPPDVAEFTLNTECGAVRFLDESRVAFAIIERPE